MTGADAAKFAVDKDSGEVILLNNANYALKNEYNFDVIATDIAGNSSEAKSVTLTVDDLAPFPALVSFTEDTGLADDNISSNGELTVSGLKFGAQWEYSTNNGLSWNLGSASAELIRQQFLLQPMATIRLLFVKLITQSIRKPVSQDLRTQKW